MQGGPEACTPRRSAGGRPNGQGISKICRGSTVMIISWSFDFVTDFFQQVTNEGSKFYTLPLLYLYSWLVNNF